MHVCACCLLVAKRLNAKTTFKRFSDFQKAPITFDGDVRFRPFLCRLKTETEGFPTAKKSSKTDITIESYGRFPIGEISYPPSWWHEDVERSRYPPRDGCWILRYYEHALLHIHCPDWCRFRTSVVVASPENLILGNARLNARLLKTLAVDVYGALALSL